MTKKDKLIAKAIVMAQVASDGGKGIDDLRYLSRTSRFVWDCGYGAKDDYILRAMELIRSTRNSMFRYTVTAGDLGDANSIVYFQFRVEGITWQISFHTFSGVIRRWRARRRKAFHTVWDRMCSRDTAEVLWDLIHED